MIRRIDDFEQRWKHEASETSKLLGALTDVSLAQAVAPGSRTLGRLGWHLAGTIVEMMGRVGLTIEGPDEHAPVPDAAAAIRDAYDRASTQLLQKLGAQWTDATLEQEDNMYGETWKRGSTLEVLVLHQTHHRGQMTVLMRQAGLRVPGLYGPSREDWAQWGMPEPVI